jgi:hypothetical protein
MCNPAAYPFPRDAVAALALTIAVIICGSRDGVMAADKSAWLGRWVIAAETCQNDGYDMLIEPDHFEIWEQACDIKNWSIKGERASLSMQCFNEGNSATRESLQLIVRGDTLERAGGYVFKPNKMVRCR